MLRNPTIPFKKKKNNPKKKSSTFLKGQKNRTFISMDGGAEDEVNKRIQKARIAGQTNNESVW